MIDINFDSVNEHLKLDNKVLMYSPRNYIQYPVIKYNGKNVKKNALIYVCMLCCAHTEIHTALFINYTSIKSISYRLYMNGKSY